MTQGESSTKPDAVSEPPAPVTAEEALIWVASIRPNALLALLRDPDNILVSQRAFAGFRANHQGLAFPTVRRRLAQEAVKDAEFGDKLRTLFQTTPVLTKTASSQPEHAPERPPRAAQNLEVRDRDKRKISDLQTRAATAEAAKAALEAKHKSLEEELSRLQSTTEAQQLRIERLERQAKRREVEQIELVKSLRERQRSSPDNALQDTRAEKSSTTSFTGGPSDPWIEAVRRNLELGHFDVVVPIVSHAYRAAPNEAEVLELAADLAQRRGDKKGEIDYLRQLTAAQIQSGRGGAALATWSRLALLKPAESTSGKPLQQIVALLPARAGAEGDSIRSLLTRVKLASPELHARIISAFSKRRDLAALFDRPSETASTGERAEVIVVGGKSITIASVIGAIDRGDAEFVFRVAEWIRAMSQTDPDSSERTLRSIADQGGDATYLIALTTDPKWLKSAIVDTSNIAWIGQEDLVKGRPRLSHVLEVRRSLRQHGFFPIFLYSDANLPYSIDDRDAFAAMLDRHEVHPVDAGVDADEEIIRDAKRMKAVVVSNDFMGDWDPANSVPKIGIALSRTGEASLIYR